LRARLEAAAIKIAIRDANDEVKCIGTPSNHGGKHFSHAAAPMELVEVGVVDEVRAALEDEVALRSKYFDRATDQGGSNGTDEGARRDGGLADRVGPD